MSAVKLISQCERRPCNGTSWRQRNANIELVFRYSRICVLRIKSKKQLWCADSQAESDPSFCAMMEWRELRCLVFIECAPNFAPVKQQMQRSLKRNRKLSRKKYCGCRRGFVGNQRILVCLNCHLDSTANRNVKEPNNLHLLVYLHCRQTFWKCKNSGKRH